VIRKYRPWSRYTLGYARSVRNISVFQRLPAPCRAPKLPARPPDDEPVHRRIGEVIDRLTGEEAPYRVWGTWDDMTAGARNKPVSLVELFQQVYQYRKQQGRFSFPDSIMPHFLGKTIIESGAPKKNALSLQAARSIMQLRPLRHSTWSPLSMPFTTKPNP